MLKHAIPARCACPVYTHAPCTGGQDRVIGTQTGLRVGLSGNCVSIPGRDKNSAPSPTHAPISLVLVSLSEGQVAGACSRTLSLHLVPRLRVKLKLHVPI